MTNGISRRAAIRGIGAALAGSRALPASVYGNRKVTALVIGGDRYHNMDYIRTALAKTLGRDLGPCPERLSAEQVESLLELVARSRSRLAAFPIQDLLAMSEKLRPGDPRQERINVPGTRGESNWSYRMPFPIDAVLGDKKLAVRARALAKARVSPGRARARKS